MLGVDELVVADDPATWSELGFTVEDDVCRLGSVRVRLAGSAAGGGIVGWTLRDAAVADELDGLATCAAAADEAPSVPATHPNGALRIDHVVVLTPSLERTDAALAAAGIEQRRVREAELGDKSVRQAFYRLGEVILEVVTWAYGAEPAPADPARFWGLVVVCADLDALAARLGERLGAPRDAVQPGRRIATLRPAAGLSPAIAFMTPDPKRG